MSESVKDIEQDYNFLEGDDDVVRLCLGDTETVFDNGEWVPGILCSFCSLKLLWTVYKIICFDLKSNKRLNFKYISTETKIFLPI